MAAAAATWCYTKSSNSRQGLEKLFGWLKAFGRLRQFQLRGHDNVSAVNSFSSRSLRPWPGCDRFHPDPPGQDSLGAAITAGVAHDGGSLNSPVPRGVRQRVEPMPSRQANCGQSGLLADRKDTEASS